MDAWHRIDIQTLGKGRCVVHESTNDNDDDGYDDGEVVSWNYEDNIARALLRHGKSHVGISGVKVTVTLDGEELV